MKNISEDNRKSKAPNRIHVGVLTLSTSKAALMEQGRDEDTSGKIIADELEKEGYSSERTILSDEEDLIRRRIKEMFSDPKIDIIITTGGTEVTSRDITVNVVRNLFDKEIPGYDESLRQIGYGDIGRAVLLSRTTTGVANKKTIFCLADSSDAVNSI